MNKLGTNWQGIRYEWRYYRRSDCIAFVGMTVFYSLAGFYMNTLMRTMQQTEPAAGVLDYLFYFLNGSNLPLMQQKQQFEIPVTYMGLMIFLSYIVGNVMTQYQPNHIIRCGTRIQWLIGKMSCIIKNIFVLFMIMFGVAFVMAKGRLYFHPEFFKRIYRMSDCTHPPHTAMTVFLMLIIPLLACIALSIIQICVTLFVAPVIGVIVLLMYNIFAIFIPRYYFLGNAAMLQRMSLFTPSGSNYVQQIWIDCAVISIIFIMNMLIVKRKDFLSSKNA